MPPVDRPVVACISLEPWDDVWRRNQHLAWQLVEQELVARLVFVEPPTLGKGWQRHSPRPGLDVVRPPLLGPKRLGGLRFTGALLRRTVLRDIDVLWVNDPTLGVHCLTPDRPASYDVTDDWRTFNDLQRIRRRIIKAEDRLARRASTIVCSQVLSERWSNRYRVASTVVQNAVDVEAFARSVPRELEGPGPHLGYIGTLHAFRLDVDLLLATVQTVGGTLHLVGPDSLDDTSRRRLLRDGRIRLHGPVPAGDVPSWMRAMDVLLCPHLVNDFTLSLDAIKAHEYAAAGRPVVATPTSGFQLTGGPGVVPASDFVAAVRAALKADQPAPQAVASWADRAPAFAGLLG